MSRKKPARSSGGRPRPAPPPVVDARLLLVAAVMASPSAYLATEGLLSPSAAVERFLVIALGCLVLSAVVRTIWPLVIGDGSSSTSRPASAGAPQTVRLEPIGSEGVSLPPIGSGLDLLEDDVDPAGLLDLDH